MSPSDPVAHHLFLLSKVVGLGRVIQTDRHTDLTPDLAMAVLTEPVWQVCETRCETTKALVTDDTSGPRAGLARFFLQRLIPAHAALAAQALAREKAVYALSPEEFAA